MSRFADRLTLVPYLAVKARQELRAQFDAHYGWKRATAAASAWASEWADRYPSLKAWLERPGAGGLWIDHLSGPRWARSKATAEDLAFADEVVSGRIPLIGAIAEVGTPPYWLRDGYSGRPWPLKSGPRYPFVRKDGSDIRTVWELSRCYHFVPLALAYWLTGDRKYLESYRVHTESWLAQNPPGLGPNWASPMDAAIRSANWALASVMFARASDLPNAFWAQVLANLRLTAWYVSRYLEWHPVYRGNHYISNGVGLLYCGALFRDDQAGRFWMRRGTAILRSEMFCQVHPDGGGIEGSVAYHRLVTEFFTFGGEIVRRNHREALPSAWWERLHLMHRFLDACLDVTGKAALIGDADDGRLHWLCAKAASSPRLHRLGIRNATVPKIFSSLAYPGGGFYVVRTSRDHAVVRCGPVGLRGAGCHDHNDQLSFELSVNGRDLVTDSGTYCYTRDLSARYRFRATAAHNAIQLGGEEQNPIRVDRPWRVLADRTRSECVHWHTDARGTVFEGRHDGFRHRPSGAICRRRIAVDAATGVWEIRDDVEGRGSESLAWRLHLAPGAVEVTGVANGLWRVTHSNAPGHSLSLVAPTGLAFRLAESEYSPSYGTKVTRPMLLLEGEIALPVTITLTVTPAPSTPSVAGG